jgi:DNA-binding MarR family transcriptional regulator
MTKVELLGYLADVPGTTGFDVAQEFGVPYATAAMALLRLVRQSLVSRARNQHAVYAYDLTDRGWERLTYLEDELEDERPTTKPAPAHWTTSDSVKGADTVKLRKFHSGLYHCPRCCVEFDLLNEANVKCDDCNGPLIAGPLEDEFDDEEE